MIEETCPHGPTLMSKKARSVRIGDRPDPRLEDSAAFKFLAVVHALAHIVIDDLVNGRGLWRNRHGRPDEVGSDDDDLPTHEIDGSDLHHGVVWAGTGGLQISDSEEGGCFRGAGHALFRATPWTDLSWIWPIGR